MPKAPLPSNEQERLNALRRFELLDTQPESIFDDIVKVVAHICDTPIALISLVDENRQWFKARLGLETTETLRDHAFCAHAILQQQPLVVSDAAADLRFADNPLVLGMPGIRFYVGIPLPTQDGLAVGTLCAIDVKPRTLSQEQLDALSALSRQVMYLFEARQTASELARVMGNMKTIVGLLPICAWCKKIRSELGEWGAIEDFIRKHSDAEFTHGICCECRDTVAKTKKHDP